MPTATANFADYRDGDFVSFSHKLPGCDTPTTVSGQIVQVVDGMAEITLTKNLERVRVPIDALTFLL